ncbi:hypothetical protein NNRS527_02379 [Nitrosospira sp. NRS527]|nr:hypothetical protein NNRS527_02379 [Nitrosospira sp. NRS527]
MGGPTKILLNNYFFLLYILHLMQEWSIDM